MRVANAELQSSCGILAKRTGFGDNNEFFANALDHDVRYAFEHHVNRRVRARFDSARFVLEDQALTGQGEVTAGAVEFRVFAPQHFLAWL